MPSARKVLTSPPGAVVLTGASRGLGLASAAHLYRRGWHVLATMRNLDGMEQLRNAVGAGPSDGRLTGIPLDLDDSASIEHAAKLIIAEVGAPDALVHNAGIAAVGSAEEMDSDALHQVFSTNFFGPVQLTQQLLPAMRGAGRGRVVVVSSLGGLRGLPATSSYSAAKGALERWAESLAYEVGPSGVGVSIVVAGTYRTDILRGGVIDRRKRGGPYESLYAPLDSMEAKVQKVAAPPEKFAHYLERALAERGHFSRHIAGKDATAMQLMNKLPEGAVQMAMRQILGIPK